MAAWTSLFTKEASPNFLIRWWVVHTNKPEHKDTYKVDGYENYPELEELYTVDKYYCMDRNTFKNMLNHLVGKNDDIDEQIEILTDRYEDLLIHEWEIAELNELY